MVRKQGRQWRQHLLAAVVAMAAGMQGGLALASGPQTAAAVPAPNAGQAGIYPSLYAGDRVVADVFVDGKVVGKIDYQAASSVGRSSAALVFPLPADTKRVRLRGSATLSGKPSRFDRIWNVRDTGHLSAPLYDRRKPWIERIRGMFKAFGEGLSLERIDGKALKKPASAAFADIEASLGAPLPPLVKVLGDWRVKIGPSSGFVTPAGMVKVTRMLVEDWGHAPKGPKGLDQMLAPEVRARFDRSLVMYVDTGNGMGALAWDPAGITPAEQRGSPPVARPGPAGAGVWFWVNQNHLDQTPTLLLDQDLRPMSAEAAMTHVFECFVLAYEDSPNDDNELVVDTSSPLGSRLVLDFEMTNRPALGLSNYDYDNCLN